MGTLQILEELRQRGVKVAAAGDRLRLYPADRVPADLVAELRQRKAEVLQALAKPTVRARVRGQDATIETARAEPCWHCRGKRRCRCALCGSGLPWEWQPGQCESCRGTGFLCWPEVIQ